MSYSVMRARVISEPGMHHLKLPSLLFFLLSDRKFHAYNVAIGIITILTNLSQSHFVKIHVSVRQGNGFI